MSKQHDLKPFPDFDSDASAEDFVDNSKLSDYDMSEFEPMSFEFEKKSAQINMRVPTLLLEAHADAERGIKPLDAGEYSLQSHHDYAR